MLAHGSYLDTCSRVHTKQTSTGRTGSRTKRSVCNKKGRSIKMQTQCKQKAHSLLQNVKKPHNNCFVDPDYQSRKVNARIMTSKILLYTSKTLIGIWRRIFTSYYLMNTLWAHKTQEKSPSFEWRWNYTYVWCVSKVLTKDTLQPNHLLTYFVVENNERKVKCK